MRWPDRWVRFVDAHGRERQIDTAISPDTWETLRWVEVDPPTDNLEA